MAGTQTPEFDLGSISEYNLFSVCGEDPASVLMSKITFFSLLTIAAFLSSIQLVGEPIECWCPAQISDAMCNYTKSFCWISKSYVIDYEDAIPSKPEEKISVLKREIDFYPFVPFIVLGMAVIFKTPNLLWNAFQGEEGLNIPKAVKVALLHDRDDEQTGQEVAFELDFALVKRPRGRQQRRLVAHSSALLKTLMQFFTAAGLFPLGGSLGTYQTGLYLMTRLLALAVTLVAYPLLGYMLRADFFGWGWGKMRAGLLDEGEPLFDSHVFPRETLCDFKVRQLQNVQQYTVQCVLPINMWSEKAFLAIWFWLPILVLANAYSYQYWLRKLLFAPSRHDFVRKHLSILSGEITETRPKRVADFALNYLNHDSILVLRILEMAAGNRFVNVVMRYLWQEYNQQFNTRAKTTTDSGRQVPPRLTSDEIDKSTPFSDMDTLSDVS